MDIKSFEVLRPLSLLYVEDDAATREELVMMLQPWVRELFVAADGQAGLELFEAKRPDIVVTDIQMPRLNGLAMSNEIRRLVPDQAIVIVSAYNDTEYLFKAIELGIDHYVTKPVNVGKLFGKLVALARNILAVRDRELNQRLLTQYKLLVDQSAIVCKFDASGRITYVNDKLSEISGFAPRELIGCDVSALRHPTEPKDRISTTLAQLGAGKNWSGIVRNRTRHGDLYVVESRLVPILDATGRVTEIVSLDVDITTHYKVYEDLVETLSQSKRSDAEQRHFFKEYKRALELGSSICVTDRHHRIVSVNQPFERLIGFQSDELQGKLVSEIMPDEAGERCLDEVQQGERVQFVSRIVRFQGKGDRVLHFSVGFVGVHNLAGAVESVILMCQDVSEAVRLNREIVDTQRELLYMLGEVVESRSLETGQHIRRVAKVSHFLAIKAGLSPEFAELIETAAPMHDIGKVGIRDAILHKPGKLDVAEFEEMKTHANIGYHILGTVDRPLIGVAAAIAHEHHERYDGEGYPAGLKADDISIEARIVGMADVLDALSSPRAYKAAWPEQRILDYFKEQRGRQFDPRLVDLLLDNWSAVQSLRGVSPADAA